MGKFVRLLLCFRALLASGGMSPNLPVAALAAMVLGLSDFLFAGTERHGAPHLNLARITPVDLAPESK